MKEKIKELILWIISIFFILSSIASVNEIIMPAMLLLLAGVILLPPVNKTIKEKIKTEELIKRYRIIRNILVITFVVVFGVNVPTQDKQEMTNNILDGNTVTSDNNLEKSVEEINQENIDEVISNVITETNGKYLGERIDGKKQGNGKYEWNDGSIYEGEFSNDQINGQGKLIIPQKGTYEGTFVNGKKSGQGTYTFSNGDKYEGNWIEDKMSGEGTYTFANGDTYVGGFLDNKFNGQGTYTKGSNKYTGTWSNNEYKK